MAHTPITSKEYSVFTNLEAPLTALFYDQMSSALSAYSDIDTLFNPNQTSSRASERTQGMGGFGDIPEYTTASGIEYDSPDVLYQMEYIHKEFARGFAVERKQVDDNEWGVINSLPTQLGLAAARTVLKAKHSIFSNAFSASYVGGDNVALCSNSHPRSPNDATVQDNLGSSALSHDAVVTTEAAMMAFTDSKGNPMNVVPDTILVSLAKKADAQVIAGSALRSGVANNDINTNASYKVIYTPYLTGNSWFLIDSMMARQYLRWFWRVQPEFAVDPKSDFDLVAKYRAYMRYSYGWDHWCWIYGHSVA